MVSGDADAEYVYGAQAADAEDSWRDEQTTCAIRGFGIREKYICPAYLQVVSSLIP